jgi:hypothetical protein
MHLTISFSPIFLMAYDSVSLIHAEPKAKQALWRGEGELPWPQKPMRYAGVAKN